MRFKKAFLPHRGILEIQGEDRAPFLQGLITNDINLVSPIHTLYTALLTPQGRFLYDFFISEENGSYFLETENDRLDELQRRLSLYKLRAQVTLIPRPDLKVYALWGEGVSETLGLQETLGYTRDQLFIDPRLLALGLRARGESPPLEAHSVSEEEYMLHRLKLGVPEAGLDLIPEKSIPLEAGLDDLHAINWTKGCYMGQELTSRTKYRGLVRKRLIPVTFSGSPPPLGAQITNQDESAGEMRSTAGSYGLALLRLEALQGGPQTFMCGKIALTPFIPSWVNLELSEA